MLNNGWKRHRLGAILLAVGVIATGARGQSLTWDASGAADGVFTFPTDGAGFWDTSTALNWNPGGASTDEAWIDGASAIIGAGSGSAGTIQIDNGSVTANAIQFNATGDGSSYTIAGNGLVLGGTTPTIGVVANQSPTIATSIGGSAGLTLNGPGTLNLGGNNTFTGGVNINSGSLVVTGNLGDSGNLISLGTPNTGTSTNDPVGSLTIAAGDNVNIGSFKASTNNAAVNTLTINNGSSLNVTSNSALSGLNASVNAAFIVGSSNLSAPITTNLTISGDGSLNVSGGTDNASFLVGIGNSNTSTNNMIPTLDMSGLANFSFTTGTAAVPANGGNEFGVGVGSGAQATAKLAVNNTITAGTIDVGDNANSTPGLSGNGPNNPSNPNALDLGSGTNTLDADTILIGGGRAIGSVGWVSGVTTGTLTIAGAAGGSSTANIVVGILNAGTPASTNSMLALAGHNVTVQAGTLTLGEALTGTSTGKNTTKPGGGLTFDTGTFNVASVVMGENISGVTVDIVSGSLTVGSGPSSTGVFNVTSSFWLNDNTNTGNSKSASAGTFTIKGGTANIGANIIDASTTNPASLNSATLTLSGGTLNMQGFAIGPAVTNPNTGSGLTSHITVNFPTLGNSAVLENLGGTGINDGGLTMNGAGTLILDGNSTYSGATTVSTGTLQVGQSSDTVPPSSALQASVTDNATLAFGSSQTTTIATTIGGSGAVVQNGSGKTILSGNNSYGGPTSITNGTLSVSSLPNGGVNSPIGSSSNAASNLVLTGGTFQYTGSGTTSNRGFTVTPTGGAIDASGTGALIFSGGSIATADAPSRATTDSITSNKVTLANVYDLVVGMAVTGTNIPAGTTITNINPAASSVTLSNTPTAAGADTLSFGVVPRTLTLTGTSAAANTLANSLTDSAGGAQLLINKSGSGTWVLSGNNTYTGTTSVNQGELSLASNLLSSSGISVGNNGTLQLQHNAAINTATLTLAAGATLDITDNSEIFDTTVAGHDATTLLADLTTAYNNGDWNGKSPTSGAITSSLAASSNGITTVGYKVSGNNFEVAYTLPGDTDLNGSVDSTDLSNLNNAIGWNDFNYDGVVNADDYSLFMLGAAYGTIPANLAPEPGAIALLAGAMIAIRRRRRD